MSEITFNVERCEDIHVTVPNHDSIALKTLQSILKQAGVSLEAFVAHL